MQVPVTGHRHGEAAPKGILLTHLRHLPQDGMKHSLQLHTSLLQLQKEREELAYTRCLTFWQLKPNKESMFPSPEVNTFILTAMTFPDPTFRLFRSKHSRKAEKYLKFPSVQTSYQGMSHLMRHRLSSRDNQITEARYGASWNSCSPRHLRSL